jgi:trigger factor
MKHTRKNISDTKVSLNIVLDAAELATVESKTLVRLAKDLKVAGFRPGKVPPTVAKKNLDGNVLGMEVAQDAINHFMVEVLDTEKLQPLDRPQVDIQKYVHGEQLEFSAELEIVPEVKLGDYKTLKAKKKIEKFTDKDVAEVIDRMRQGMAEKKDVTRAAKTGDEVIIDFKGTNDGKEIAGASGTDYPLSLGSNTFIPGFEEGLIGKKAGETFDLPLTFPKDYHHKPLAGQKVIFAITVKVVKEVTLPALDDAFAAKAGQFKTVDELKADVKRELTDQKEREALEAFKDALIEELVNGSTIPTPEILIADQLASLERDFTQNLMYRGMTLPQYLEEQGKTKEEWLESELREQAIRRVKVGLALAELSKLENIDVSFEELDARLGQMMQQYGNDPKIREQFDNPEVRRDLANRVMTEKTVERLVEINQK